MNYRYSERITRILGYSKEEALRLNNDYIGPEHLMLGIIRDGESRALEALQKHFFVNIPSVKDILEKSVKDDGQKLLSTDITLNQKSSMIMRLTVLEARLLKSEESDAEHLLLAIMKQKDNMAARVLSDCDVTYKELYDSFAKTKAAPQPESNVEFDEDDEEDAPPPSSGTGKTSSSASSAVLRSSQENAISRTAGSSSGVISRDWQLG